MMKEIKAFSIYLDKEQIDAIEYITNNKIHSWKHSDTRKGEIDLLFLDEDEDP